MKNKLFLITALLGLVYLSPSSAYAALKVTLESPKSPTNQNTFNLSFSALDTNDSPITIKCFKKSPSESDFSQFDADKALSAGGNSGYCEVNSSIVNDPGSYSFFVSAVTSAENMDSQVVVVDYNTSGPGTPNSYSKEKINNCDYRIKFRTADDGGKTIKVDLFRSDTKTIGIDAGGRVATLMIGSNLDGQIVNSVPDCQKEYFYVIRAVDSSDNVSGVVGDGYTKIITETITTATTDTTTTPGALIAGSSQVGQPTTQESGSSDDASAEEEASDGAQTDSGAPTPEVLGSQSPSNKIYRWFIFPLLLVASYFLMRSFKKVA